MRKKKALKRELRYTRDLLAVYDRERVEHERYRVQAAATIRTQSERIQRLEVENARLRAETKKAGS